MPDFVTLETLNKLLAEGKISSAEYDEQKKFLFERTMRESGERKNPKSGIVYILLAFFLGTLGVHNLYAGFWKRGLTQLFLTLFSPLFLFLPLMITSLWALLELLFKNKAANGHIMSGNRKLIWFLRLAAVAVFVAAAMSANYVDVSLPVTDINQEDLSAVKELMGS